MATPTTTDVKSLDYPYQGQPFVRVPAKDGFNTNTLDYPYQGQPFIAQPDSSGGGEVGYTGNIKTVLGTTRASVKSANSVAIDSVKTWLGLV